MHPGPRTTREREAVIADTGPGDPGPAAPSATPRSPAPSAMDRWIDRFVDEKGYDSEQVFEHQTDLNTHMVSLGSIVQAFKNAPPQEQKAIRDNIVKLDLRDPAAPLKYLGHLGGAVAHHYENGSAPTSAPAPETAQARASEPAPAPAPEPTSVPAPETAPAPAPEPAPADTMSVAEALLAAGMGEKAAPLNAADQSELDALNTAEQARGREAMSAYLARKERKAADALARGRAAGADSGPVMQYPPDLDMDDRMSFARGWDEERRRKILGEGAIEPDGTCPVCCSRWGQGTVPGKGPCPHCQTEDGRPLRPRTLTDTEWQALHEDMDGYGNFALTDAIADASTRKMTPGSLASRRFWADRGRLDYDGTSVTPLPPEGCTAPADRQAYHKAYRDMYLESRKASRYNRAAGFADGETAADGTCPLHRGPWGRDVGCEHCTDILGNPERSDTMSQEEYEDALIDQVEDSWWPAGRRAYDGSGPEPAPARLPALLQNPLYASDRHRAVLQRAIGQFQEGWRDAHDDAHHLDQPVTTDEQIARLRARLAGEATADPTEDGPVYPSSPVNLYMMGDTLVRADSPLSATGKVYNPRKKKWEVRANRTGSPLIAATEKQISDHGRDIGRCMICSKPLTGDAAERGIGATCQRKLNR